MQKALASLPGVGKDIKANTRTATATFKIDKEKFYVKKAVDALAKAGYPDSAILSDDAGD